jgi:hypothetical protein
VHTDCAFYPASKKLVVINNSGETQKTRVYCPASKIVDVSLIPYGIQIIDL